MKPIEAPAGTPVKPKAKSIDELKQIARRLRIDIVKMIGAAGSGHPGGSLSEVELLAALFFRVMRHDPTRPQWPDRDRFILLGNGISIGIGTALAARLDQRDYHTFVLVGDGEIQEGQNWEAAMFAGFHKLANLTLIVDYNQQQLDGWVKDILDPAPIAEKFRAFRWRAVEIDGHDFAQVIPALEEARAGKGGQPTVVVARTVKGKGVSFMENNVEWHGIAPKPEQVEAAVKELEGESAIGNRQ